MTIYSGWSMRETCPRLCTLKAFVKQNGAHLNHGQGRHKIVLEYADLLDELILLEGLKVRAGVPLAYQ